MKQPGIMIKQYMESLPPVQEPYLGDRASLRVLLDVHMDAVREFCQSISLNADNHFTIYPDSHADSEHSRYNDHATPSTITSKQGLYPSHQSGLTQSDFCTWNSSNIATLTDNELKYCVALATTCAKTRICTDKESGFEAIIPVYIEDNDRNLCIRLYDICTEELKVRNRMYIPQQIERVAPDRGRLKFLISNYINQRSSAAVKAQTKGTQFNRLFGSRG